jgi:hypothetical protein
LIIALVAIGAVAAAGAAAGNGKGNGGNSANAKMCQKDGWMSLAQSDGTPFTSQEACVSYAAQGGTLIPKPACTAGSENFSEDADGSMPTTFAGGTIDGPYGTQVGSGTPGVLINGVEFLGDFAAGAHVLYTGQTATAFGLTFTNAVNSVQLDAESDSLGALTLTLDAYDASNTLVGSDAQTVTNLATLSVSSTSDNIKSFTVQTSDPAQLGLAFTNIVWGCS